MFPRIQVLTDIADSLLEPSKKINVVDRLSSHLERGISDTLWDNYRSLIKHWTPSEPVIHIDDSDVVKPDGYKFEALGTVRDGSESTSSKNVYKKGYHVTEACVMTDSGHPVSIFSRIHSSAEKGYKSANSITFSALKQEHSFLKKLLLLWTEAMMTTKCSPNLRNSDRIMCSDLPKNENSFFMENGFRLPSYVPVEKGKLNYLFFITERNTLRIFPMSKSRSRHQKKMSILFWFTASQNIR